MKSPNIPLFNNKTEADLCIEIEEYLKGKNGIPLPSLEDFCLKHNYSFMELEDFRRQKSAINLTISKIKNRAVVTLEKFLLLDISNMEFKDDSGKSYKLDKKGIMYQLDKLKYQKY